MSELKEQVIRLIESLPDECTLEDIQYHLYIREKVAHGIRAIDEGKVLSEEEADTRVQEWVDSLKENS